MRGAQQADLLTVQAVEASPPPPSSAGKKRKADDEPLLPEPVEARVDEQEGLKEEEDPDEEIVLVTFPAANIVGLKHYRGLATRAPSQLGRVFL